MPLPSEEFLIRCNNSSSRCICFRTPKGCAEKIDAYPLDNLLRKVSKDPLPVLPQKEAAIMKATCPCSVRLQSESNLLLSYPLEQLDWSLAAPSVRGLDTFFTWRLNYAKRFTVQYFRENGATDAILAQMKEQAAAGETWTAVVLDLVFTHLEHENRTLFDLNDELFPCEKLQQRVEFLEKRVKQWTKIIRRKKNNAVDRRMGRLMKIRRIVPKEKKKKEENEA